MSYFRDVLELKAYVDRFVNLGLGHCQVKLDRRGCNCGNGPVSIGDNCVVHHNVTIGQRVARGDQGVPRIGDRVWIGPGCIITGSIAIGDDVTISAGSVLSRDVPSGCLVAGNPARVIAKDYDNTDFIGLLPESG